MAKTKFYPSCIARNAFEFQSHILKKTEKRTGFLQIIASVVWCHETWQICFVYWSFLVIMNKFSRISSNHLTDSVIQLLESGKTQKVASFPCLGRKNLQIFSWYSLPDLKYFFMKHSKNEVFAHVLVNFIEWLPWK